jgi:hypothetical protein
MKKRVFFRAFSTILVVECHQRDESSNPVLILICLVLILMRCAFHPALAPDLFEQLKHSGCE